MVGVCTVPKVGDVGIRGERGDRRADRGLVERMTGASFGGSVGVQIILLGRGSQVDSMLSFPCFLNRVGVFRFAGFSGVSDFCISLRASSNPNRRPRSRTELLSGGGITERTSIAVTLMASCVLD